MTHFIIDCDDVLLDWTEGFRRWLQRYGLFSDRVLREPILTWDLATWLGCSKEAVSALIEIFNTCPDFQGLNRIEETLAKDPLRQVRDLLTKPGNTLTVVSAYLVENRDPSVSALQKRLRLKNLQERYGLMGIDLISLPLGSAKSNAFKEIYANRGACVSLDDNPFHAKAAADAGHLSYVFARSHNRVLREEYRFRNVAWVDDWSDFVSRFTGHSILDEGRP